MIHGEMYKLNCPYDIHHICDMTLTCNVASHCICMRTSHFIGVSAWLKSNTTMVINEWAWYHWTKSNRVALLHEMVKKKLVSGNNKKGWTLPRVKDPVLVHTL